MHEGSQYDSHVKERLEVSHDRDNQEPRRGERHPHVKAKSRVQGFEDSKRVRYFRDDDAGPDVATLAKQARCGDDLHDMDAALASNIAARRRFKERDLDVDEEYDNDGGLDLYERRCVAF
jgi:hypothetical protein